MIFRLLFSQLIEYLMNTWNYMFVAWIDFKDMLLLKDMLKIKKKIFVLMKSEYQLSRAAYLLWQIYKRNWTTSG